MFKTTLYEICLNQSFYPFEEVRTQSIGLDNSVEKYLLIDDSKIGCEDLYAYYNLSDFTTVIVNDIENSQVAKIEKYVPIFIDMNNLWN